MAFLQSIEGCLEAAIGAGGVTPAELEAWLGRVGPGLDGLRRGHADGSLPLLRVPQRRDDIADAMKALERLGKGARTLVFFGTGGSSLGGQTIAQLGGWYVPGEHRPGQEKRPRTRFYDNLDPRTLERALASLDLEATRFIVISKSGNTPETLAQTLAAIQALKDEGLGKRLPEMLLGLTEPARPGATNGLRALFQSLGIPLLDHDPDIGGRFAALTNVGLLPALARGMDAEGLRAGAGAVVEEMLAAKDVRDVPAALGAAAAVALIRERGVRTTVMMPYMDRLGRFAHWYVQLWAESLGKDGAGSVPVAALGPVDQHSQLQLYLDGPREIMVTVIRSACAGTGPEIDPKLAEAAGAAWLGGRRAGDVVAAQQRAIPQALIEAGRPVRTIDIENLDEAALGGLMMHFMLETILAAGLLGADPFGQPAVETGKRLTRRYLSGKKRA